MFVWKCKGPLIGARLQNQEEPESEFDTLFFNNENNQVLGNKPKVVAVSICLRTLVTKKERDVTGDEKGEPTAFSHVVRLSS